MWRAFLARACLPQLALVAAAAACCLTQSPWPDESWVKKYPDDAISRYKPGTPEYQEFFGQVARLWQGRGPVYDAALRRAGILIGLVLACYVLTDYLLTRRQVRPLFAAGGFVGLLLAAAFGVWTALMLAAYNAPAGLEFFVAADAVALLWLLGGRGAYRTFADWYAPVLQEQKEAREQAGRRRQVQEAEARRRAEIAAARQEAERFYTAHAGLLRDAFPPELFRSSLNAAIPETLDAPAAYAAARALIERIQPLVASAREVRRLEEEQTRRAEETARRTRNEIGALQARIAALTGRTDDEAVDELLGLQRQLARLQGRQLRSTIGPDDL